MMTNNKVMDCEKVFVTYDGESDTYTIKRLDKILPNKYNEAIFYQVNVNTREEVIEYINLYNLDGFTYYRDELGDLEHETLNTYFGVITKELYDKWQNYKSPYKDEYRTDLEYEAYVFDYKENKNE